MSIETPELRAELSSAAINDLPDSAFAYIEPGGEKDDEGKTTPRSLRHFPIHDKAHVENALARLSQSPFGEKAMPKIKAAAKKFGIDVADEDDDKRSRRRRERHRAVPLTPEVRFFAPTQVEVRSQPSGGSDDDIVISGSAIMYGAQYRVVDVFGEFRETIHAGAANNLLERGVDCRLLLNHGGLPMARTTSGTMKLIDTPEALRFEANLSPRSQLSNDFAEAIKRGDLSQMSVGMVVSRDKWGADDAGAETRDIFQLGDLLDVSGVTYPCSETTHIEVAQRMAFAMPIESRARLRNMEAELRAGKTLSASNQGLLVQALKALHDLAGAGGVDAGNLDGDDEARDADAPPEVEPGISSSDDGTMGGDALGAYDGSPGYADGSGTRHQEDPGEAVSASRNKTATLLRLQLEQRKRQRINA